jgi:nucleoid DNA-binding protein
LNNINSIPVNIISIICELLLHNQKAVVPGFGSFLISNRSAELNKITRVLTPPAKEVRFDSNQQTDDGQLAGYLMQTLKLNKTAASVAINQFVKSSEDQLSTKGVLLLEGFGMLTRESSGRVTFKANEEILKRINLFELPKLGIPVAQPVTPTMVARSTREHPVVPGRKKRRGLIPATIAALIIGLSALVYFSGIYGKFVKGDNTNPVSISTNDKTDRLVFGSNANTDSSQGASDTLREKISRELDARTARGNALAYKEAETKPVVQKQKQVSEPSPPTFTNDGKPYHIIAGAFLIPNNAERQKKHLESKGYSPALLPKRGNYFMVSIGSYDTNEQAVAAMRQMRGNLKQELWVMKM